MSPDRVKRGGALAIACGLALALALQPVIAAETGGADQAPAQQDDKSGGKEDAKSADKSDEKKAGPKAVDEIKGKGAGKSGDKEGEKPERPEAANAESKQQDPCDTEKQLIKFRLRDELCKLGVKLGVTETSEVLGNPTGGIRQGALYEGVTDLNLGIDLRPMFHVRGNIFARAYQIHGRGLSANNLGNLNLASNIEAERTTRLNELWYEQHFDNWRLRVGQQTIGTEFFNPDSSRLFVNSTFGWPTQPSLDLPSGGPGYPLATPAIRVRIDPMEGLTVFTALFNGDPTGAGIGGSQLRDASGTAFRTSDGAWAVAEIRYNPDDSDKNGSYRLGGWYNSERFRDLRFDTNGNSLASPGSNGRARLHDGDYTVYVNVDQPVLVNEEEHTRLTVFARAGVVPTDRNLIDLYADAGLTYGGAFGRADDRIGLALAYARVGSAAQGSDADVARFTGSPFPVRTGEIVVEVTYQLQLSPWWQVQPDFQYIFNPGGGVLNPNARGRRIGDAAVLGLRTTVTF